MEGKNRNQIIISVIIIIIALSIATSIILLFDNDEPIGNTPYPIVQIIPKNNSSTYTFFINNCYDPENVLKLEDVYIYFINGSYYYKSPKYLLIDIINNNGTITFYDNDRNGRLSKNDEFIFDASIIWPGNTLRIGYKPRQIVIGDYQIQG